MENGIDPYNIEIVSSGSGADYTADEDDEQISASTLVTALASSNITVRQRRRWLSRWRYHCKCCYFVV